MIYLVLLTIVPILLSILTFMFERQKSYYIGIFGALVIIFCALFLFFTNSAQNINDSFQLSNLFHIILTFLDLTLLLFFTFTGLKTKNKYITFFAVLQLIIYGYIKIFTNLSHLTDLKDLLIDQNSLLMFLIINIVGSLIVLYGYKYIEFENASETKKRQFIAILWSFLAVMNLISVADSLLLFFFLFEMTALYSYLLIGFRKDEISTANAQKALWINQIGGVFILCAIIFGGQSFSSLGQNGQIVIIFLTFAAFVKGAMIPFSGWLLGAMVAPTPVSAILHSATMVKIAPFMILKIAPFMGEGLSILTFIFGSFVYLVASVLALGKENFKEILAYSTIALLAMMMAIGSLKIDHSAQIVYALILFHAISKGLLFLEAGILEKIYHKKSVENFEGLFWISKKTAIFIIVAFGSITLPPFGMFFAKLFGLQVAAIAISQNIFAAIGAILLILGSVVLILVYFKVVSLFFVKKESQNYPSQNIFTFSTYSLFLIAVLFIPVIFWWGFEIEKIIFILFGLIFIFSLLTYFLTPKKGQNKIVEYCGGEQNTFVAHGFYFFELPIFWRAAVFVSLVFFAAILISGAF